MNVPRRTFLHLAAGAAATALTSPAVPAAAPSTVKTPIDLDLQSGSGCDCHVHVLDPARFPYSPRRALTPPPATVEDLQNLLRDLHLKRVIVVQPGPYGTDNSCILDAVRQLGPIARAVAIIDKSTSPAKLEEMVAGGCRGVRLPFEVMGVTDPTAITAAISATEKQIGGLNLILHVYSRPSIIAQLKGQLAELSVPLVIDHFGGAQAAEGVDQTGFEAVIDLVQSGRAYVKISAANRISQKGPDYADATPFAQALVKANPDRVLWGSDWPHLTGVRGRPLTGISPPPEDYDDGMVLNQLSRWVPDPTIRKKILVENPARVYGFS